MDDSQKEFNLAFIVTQDLPYNDAAYAFFSLMAQELMNQDSPREYSSLAPFYWATGCRATLNTRLAVDVSEPLNPFATPTAMEIPPTETPAPATATDSSTEVAKVLPNATTAPATPSPEESAVDPEPSRCACSSLGFVALPAMVVFFRKRVVKGSKDTD